MAIEIDNLQVKITANAQTATNALNSLTKALKDVKTALTGMKNGVSVTDSLAKSLNQMNGALNTLSTGSTKKLQKLANAIDSYTDSLARLKAINGNSVVQSIQEVSDALSIGSSSDMNMAWNDMIQKNTEALGQLGETISALKDKIKGVKKTVEETNDHVKKANENFSKLFKSIGRIAFYRTIRSAMKAVTEAFSEGLKNAYMFSKQNDNFTRLAETMDRLKSITAQMINQLGAFWGEIQQFILPAIDWIVDKVRWVAEKLTEVFAAVNGADTYLVAKYVAAEWEEATDNIKKYKQQLLGLDELNNLTNQQNTSKKKETDYSTLYDIASVGENAKKIAGVINAIKFGISDVLFDWGDLSGSDIEAKLVTGLLGIAGGLFAGVPGAIAGTLAGIGLSLIIDTLEPAKASREYDEVGWFDILYPALTGLAGSLIGWTLSKGSVKGAFIGMSVGAALGMTLNELFDFSTTMKISDAEDLYNLLRPGVYGMMGTLVGLAYGGGKGAIIGLTVGTTIGMMLSKLDPAQFGLTYGHENLFALLEPALFGLTGGLIGFKFGSKTGNAATGMFMGMVIGTSVGFLLQTIDEIKNKGLTADFIIKRLVAGLNGIVAGAIVFSATKNVKAAVITMTIGVSLSLILSGLEISKKIGKKISEAVGSLGESAANTEITVGSNGNVQLNPFASLGSGVTAAQENKTVVDKVTDALDIFGLKKKNQTTTWTNSKGQQVGGWSGKFATGGIPTRGTLFYAGENGSPEWIGSMGGNTAVANTEQMTDAIYKAAYMGMSQALRENGGNGMSGYTPATGDDLFLIMRKKANAYNKMTGNPAFN